MPTDLRGQRFGKLLVHQRVVEIKWLCLCDCGKSALVTGGNLHSGHTLSCGCTATEKIVAHNTKHGMSKSKEFRIWIGIRRRCEDPKEAAYPRYGGRGIFVAPEFSTFEKFYAYVGPCPAGMTLDRIDNDGPYAPGNVRWASYKTQNRNRRDNRLLTIEGRTAPLPVWCEERGLSVGTVYGRLKRGWDHKRALEEPIHVKTGHWRKVTPEQINAIREMSAVESQQRIAEKFRLSQAAISHILRSFPDYKEISRLRRIEVPA